MNSRSLSTIAIVGFLLLGGIFMGLRYRSIRNAQIAREDSLWELTYTVHFDADVSAGQSDAQLRLALPFNTRHCQVLNLNDQPWNIASPNLRAEDRVKQATRTRVLLLTARQSGTYDVSAKFLLRLSPRAHMSREPSLENLTLDSRTLFLRSEENIPTTAQSVRDTLQLLPENAVTEAEQIQWVFEHCGDIDSSAGADAPDDAESALTGQRQGTPLARARAMVTLCRALQIPARLVTGFRIHQGVKIEPQVWVEVYLHEKQIWIPFDPTEGWSLTLPMDYVPARRGGDEIQIDPKNVKLDSARTFYSIKRLKPDPKILQAGTPHPIQILDLTRLPVPMHTVMKILLLLPFAALITTFIRNVIGVGTFGTFSPALLAMSFIYADVKTGLAILVIVIAVGLFGRTFLERLRLLTVPRLSIILTMVILCVVFGLSLLNYMLPAIRAEVVLLPMVILTMLIERFHVSVEEDGLVFTLQLASGTLVVAVLCYLVLGSEVVGDLVLKFPEAHFLTIAAFIVLGRYAGYRLTELWRFRDLVEPSEPVR